MIQILDSSLNVLETITNETSVMFTKRFTQTGSFTIGLPLNSTAEYIKKDAWIKFTKDNVTNLGIIEYINKNEDGYQIQGYDFKCLMMWRVAQTKKYSGAIETVIKQILTDNLVGDRAYPNFTIATDLLRGETLTDYMIESDTIENVLLNLCETYNIGYDITLNSSNQLVFDIILPDTVTNYSYSTANKNISAYEYTEDALQETNVCYNICKSDGLKLIHSDYYDINNYRKWNVSLDSGVYYGKDGGVAVRPYQTDDFQGMKSPITQIYYVYYNGTITTEADSNTTQRLISNGTYEVIGAFHITNNAIDISNHEYPLYYANYTNKSTMPTGYNRKECMTSINEKSHTTNSQIAVKDLQDVCVSATASIITREDYGAKWNVGDYVNITVNIFNQQITLTQQITEVQETYERNNYQIEPTFGKVKESVIRKIIKGR